MNDITRSGKKIQVIFRRDTIFDTETREINTSRGGTECPSRHRLGILKEIYFLKYLERCTTVKIKILDNQLTVYSCSKILK